MSHLLPCVFFRERITNGMSEISPPTRTDVDDLGSDTDFNLRGSFEVLHFPEGPYTLPPVSRHDSVSCQELLLLLPYRPLLLGHVNGSR